MAVITASKKIKEKVFLHIKEKRKSYWEELKKIQYMWEDKIKVVVGENYTPKLLKSYVPFETLMNQMEEKGTKKEKRLYDIDDLSQELQVSHSFITHNPDKIKDEFGFTVAGLYKRKKLYTKI